MNWKLLSQEEFLHYAVPELEKDEAENNLMLAVFGYMQSHPGRSDFYAFAGGRAAALQMEGRNLLLSRMDGSVASALPPLLKGRKVDGVVGVDKSAELFCAAYPAGFEKVMAQKVFRLLRLKEPSRTVSGSGSLLRRNEAELAEAWIRAFYEEADPREKIDGERIRRIVADRPVFIWREQGEAVAMAIIVGETKNGARIGAVYTPKDKRGRGFASAATHLATKSALEKGKRMCFLYTDAANPASNKIYRSLGYEEICFAEHWRRI